MVLFVCASFVRDTKALPFSNNLVEASNLEEVNNQEGTHNVADTGNTVENVDSGVIQGNTDTNVQQSSVIGMYMLRNCL